MFSSFDLGILGFRLGFCLEEVDREIRFLMDEEEMVPKKRVLSAAEASALAFCHMIFAEQENE